MHLVEKYGDDGCWYKIAGKKYYPSLVIGGVERSLSEVDYEIRHKILKSTAEVHAKAFGRQGGIANIHFSGLRVANIEGNGKNVLLSAKEAIKLSTLVTKHFGMRIPVANGMANGLPRTRGNYTCYFNAYFQLLYTQRFAQIRQEQLQLLRHAYNSPIEGESNIERQGRQLIVQLLNLVHTYKQGQQIAEADVHRFLQDFQAFREALGTEHNPREERYDRFQQMRDMVEFASKIQEILIDPYLLNRPTEECSGINSLTLLAASAANRTSVQDLVNGLGPGPGGDDPRPQGPLPDDLYCQVLHQTAVADTTTRHVTTNLSLRVQNQANQEGQYSLQGATLFHGEHYIAFRHVPYPSTVTNEPLWTWVRINDDDIREVTTEQMQKELDKHSYLLLYRKNS